MADYHDVISAEATFNNTLSSLQNTTEEKDIYLSTKAICEAIIAVGVRLDYVIRDVAQTYYDALR